MREVFFWPAVENRLWQLVPEEKYRNKLTERLCYHLEKHYARLRGRRHPDDERYFVVTLFLIAGEDLHTFEFIVDDSTADTCLIVADVIHTLGKAKIR